MTLRVAVVGAGYWGPNLVRNFRGSPDWDLVAVCDLDADARRARSSATAATSRSTTSLDDAAGPRRRRRGRDRHAGPHPRADRARGAARPASTSWSRSRWPTASPTAAAMVDARPTSRPGPDDRPHLLLHAGGPAHPRARRTTARSATSSSSTRCGSTSAWSSPTSTCSGTSRRTTCRSSTSSCPAGSRRWTVSAPRRRPARRRQGLRRLPDAAARPAAPSRTSTSTGSARPRSARWSSAAAERTLVWDDLNPQQRLSVYDRGVDLRPAGRSTRPSARRRPSPTGSATPGRPALPEREALGAMVAEFAAAIREGRAAAHRRRAPGCGCCPCSRRPRQQPRRRRWRARSPSTSRRSPSWRLRRDEHALQGARVLVTGGAGTIGSTIVDQLLDAGVGAGRRPRQPRPRPPGEPRRRAARPAGSSWSRATSATATWSTT